MALVVKDRVKETSTSIGTGDFTLAGAVAGFQAFSAALANGDTTYYAITDAGTGAFEVGLGTYFEVGLGTYNAGVLTRTTILESTNAGAAVNFGAGEKEVFITYPAEKAVYADASGNISVPGLVDGRDLAADGSKLDGIESGATADQTGAEIKSLYEAQANTNAYTDAEKSKLAGIEAGATADQTASEILTAIKTVDGSASGLDADLLDGQHATAFATAAQGALADSAVQPGDNISTLTNNSGYITGNQTITLSGDVSGSGTTSIVVTVADDSHNHVISNVDGLQAALDAKLDDTQKGAANGLAELDATGKVPSAQLPSYVDDVLEYAAEANFPATGETGKLYVALDTNDVYRWTGSAYVKVSDAVSTADQATKLATARNIALTGAVTGSANFDGSANISITTTATSDPTLTINGDASGSATFTNLGNATLTLTVADDSHNHIIGNVDGLQGVLDSKLPLAGGTMTGNITFNSTQLFDGRDVSADGAKLDGIEAGATADQTITAGAGLTGGGTGNVTLSHADTSSQASVNNSGGTVIQDVTLDTYGHVTGLVSYNLDGRYYTESEADSRFVNVTGDTMTGDLTIDKNTPRIDFKADQSGSNVGGRIELNENGNLWLNAQGGKDLWLNWLAPNSAGSYADLNVGDGNSGTYILRVEGSSRTVSINGNTAFHDGYHPNADKLTTARNIALTGAVTGNANFDGSGNISIATTATSDPTLTINGDASGSATFTNLGNATLTLTIADDSHNHVISNVDGLQTALDGKLSTSGKAADSNLLDGLDLHTGRNNEANKVVRTDGSGYIQAGWINTTSGATTSTLARIYASQDGYIRYVTPATFRSQIIDGYYLARDYHDSGRNLNLTTNSTSTAGGIVQKSSSGGFQFQIYGDGSSYGFLASDWGAWDVRKTINGQMQLRVSGSNYTVWHAGNDGSGSGLDADLLDGQHGSYYYPASNPNGYTSNVGDITGVTAGTNITGGGTSGTVTVSVVASPTFTTVTATDFNTTSDATLKTNVMTIEDASAKVDALRGVTFDWIDSGVSEVGVIAQEVEAVVPELVSTNEDGIKSVKYGNMVALLIEAVKEQQKRIEELESKLNS